MRTTFRTSFGPAVVGRAIFGGILILIAVPSCLTGPVWIVSGLAAEATSDGLDSDGLRIAFCGLSILVLMGGLAWFGWTLLPPFRIAEVSLSEQGLRLTANGQTHEIGWSAVNAARVAVRPVARRLLGNGPYDTWHLVVEGDEDDPVKVPLDTFGVSVDEVVAAFRRFAPDTVELDVESELEVEAKLEAEAD